MKVTKLPLSAVKPTFLEFVKEKILPQSNNWQIAGITFFLLQKNSDIDYIINNQVKKYFADKDGNLDLDSIYANAKEALHKAGGSLLVPLIDWKFDKEDIDSIYNIAQKKLIEVEVDDKKESDKENEHDD